MSKSKLLFHLAATICILAGTTFASSTTSFNFGTGGVGDLGNNEIFTQNGLSVTFYGYVGNGQTGNLYFKSDGGDETGLGVKESNFDYEVQGSSFLQFNTSGLVGPANATTLAFGSVQSGEKWSLYGSNTLGQRGVLLLTGSAVDNVSITKFLSSYKFISVGAVSGDVLLSGLTVTDAPTAVTPEPASVLIFGSGLLAVAFTLRKQIVKSGK